MAMKKKIRSTASGTAKRRKSGVSGRKAAPPRTRAFSSEVDTGSREENASNKELEPPFRFHRNGKGSTATSGDRFEEDQQHRAEASPKLGEAENPAFYCRTAGRLASCAHRNRA